MGTVQSKIPSFFIPSPEESATILATAEEKDKYHERCKYVSLNLVARKGMRYVATAAAHAQAIPPVPENHWILRSLPDRIPIIVLDGTADGGMPHTRGTAICCPGGIAASSTLLHELVHVHQKVNRSAWAAIYRDALQFKPWLGTLPDELEYRRRINPDTVESAHWIWRDRWVPVPIFLRPDAPRLSDMRVYFYDADTTEWQSMPPPAWVQFFGRLPDSHQEHPHELAAYWIGENRDVASPAYRRFQNTVHSWFSKDN